MVARLFIKFDADQSGQLDKREAFRLLNHVLVSQGQKSASFTTFLNFFNKYDINKDGVISQHELTIFVKNFLGIQDESMEIVNSIWSRFDANRKGYLERRDAHSFLNSLLAAKGQNEASLS